MVSGWGILSHPAVLVKGGGNSEVKEKEGGGVELGGALGFGSGSLFPWFPSVTSPVSNIPNKQRDTQTKTEREIFSEVSSVFKMFELLLRLDAS